MPKVYLNKILSEESEINIIIMPDNDGKGRKRRFYSDNNVNNIHQICSSSNQCDYTVRHA